MYQGRRGVRRLGLSLGLAVSATLVGGCSVAGGGASPVATSTASTTTSSAASTTSSAPAGRTIEITVAGRVVTPAPTQVDLGVGETLTLVVTSDHADELHAHGFEVEKTLTAGTPTTITLTGRDAGVFEVETHEPPLTLLTVAVR